MIVKLPPLKKYEDYYFCEEGDPYDGRLKVWLCSRDLFYLWPELECAKTLWIWAYDRPGKDRTPIFLNGDVIRIYGLKFRVDSITRRKFDKLRGRRKRWYITIFYDECFYD